MRLLFFFGCIIAVAGAACHSKSVPQHATLNAESVDTRGNPMLLGKCTEQRLQQPPFSSWFIRNYNNYAVDTPVAEQLKPLLAGKQFMIFMGTWCGDSKREVPGIFRLFDYCGIKPEQVELIMLDSHDSVYKQSPGHEERGWNIHRVPDLIVLANGKEMGRIVESPVVSIEKDLLNISSGKPYTPNYRIVQMLLDLFRQKSLHYIQNNLGAISVQATPLKTHPAELNSYGYVLMAAGEMKKAEIAFRLNTLLYPDKPSVFSSLTEFYLKQGDTARANHNYRRVLELQPGNERAQKMQGR